MGMTVDVLRSRAHVPKDKVRPLVNALVQQAEEDFEDPESDELFAALEGLLEDFGLEPEPNKDGSVDIEFVSEKWYDETLDAFQVISRFTEGEFYFAFQHAGDVWRYVLANGEVVEQSVAALIWAQNASAELTDLNLDIDLDVVSDREKLKAAL